jgi:hypothetical protein
VLEWPSRGGTASAHSRVRTSRESGFLTPRGRGGGRGGPGCGRRLGGWRLRGLGRLRARSGDGDDRDQRDQRPPGLLPPTAPPLAQCGQRVDKPLDAPRASSVSRRECHDQVRGTHSTASVQAALRAPTRTRRAQARSPGPTPESAWPESPHRAARCAVRRLRRCERGRRTHGEPSPCPAGATRARLAPGSTTWSAAGRRENLLGRAASRPATVPEPEHVRQLRARPRAPETSRPPCNRWRCSAVSGAPQPVCTGTRVMAVTDALQRGPTCN